VSVGSTMPILIATAPFTGALLAFLLALAIDGAGHERTAALVGAAVLAVAGVLGIVGAFSTVTVVARVVLAGGPFSGLAGAIAIIAAIALAGLGATPDAEARGIAALVPAVIAGSALALSSVDLLLTLAGLEIAALAGYALVVSRGDRGSGEAALKYVVQGAVASGLAVYGLAAAVGLAGPSTGYGTIAEALSRTTLLAAAATSGVLVLATLAFKAGAVPFHSWAPDAYEAAPAPAAAVLATGPKIAALTALVVLFSRTGFSGVASGRLAVVIAVLCVASIVVGNLGALRQRSYARMLAYSGIAQVGYALVGPAAGPAAAGNATVFAVTYALATAGAFLADSAVRERDAGWDGSIAGLAGLGRRRPILAAAIAVCMFSLIGMPPLAGFWGKLAVFGGAVSAGAWWLALVGLIGSVVSFGYYGAVLRAMYLEGRDALVGESGGLSTASAGVIVLAVAVAAVGALPLVSGLNLLYRIFGLG